MADSQNSKINTGSVLKVMFLPGITNSAKQVTQSIPAFIGLIGTIFERSGLLRRNHPVVFMGEEGAEKVSFGSIMIEAYKNLKLTGGNVYQWGMYLTVCGLIIAVLSSAAIVTFYASDFFSSGAAAQTFSHPLGDTSANTIPDPRDTIGVGAFNFSTYTDSGTAHSDWGITILDKLFREGIMQKGGALQNGVGAVMYVYNTAVLIIASIMILWLMISLVLDTAKTGTLGGGRHNMVWAPIRIIFALGLIIPLGDKGYSVGQMMVIKLAEMGSNLGTEAWVKYVETVVHGGAGNLTTDTIQMEDIDPLVATYSKVWMCTIAYNYGLQIAGNTDADSKIVPAIDLGKAVSRGNGAYVHTYSFSDGRDHTCGSMTLPTKIKDIPTDPIEKAAVEFLNSANESFVKPITGDRIYSLINNNLRSISNSQRAIDMNGSMTKNVKKFACSIVNMHHQSLSTSDCSDMDCGQDPANDVYPNYSCYENILDKYQEEITAKLGAAQQKYASDIRTLGGDRLIDSAKKEGWPSMGWWYYSLFKTTFVSMGAGKLPVTVSFSETGSGALGDSVKQVLIENTNWWRKQKRESPEISTADNSARQAKADASSGSVVKLPKLSLAAGTQNFFEKIIDMVTPGSKKETEQSSFDSGIANSTVPDSANLFAPIADLFFLPVAIMYNVMVGIIEDDTYPIIKLAQIGNAMMMCGNSLMVIRGIIYLAGALSGLGFAALAAVPGAGNSAAVAAETVWNIVVSIVEGPFGKFMQTVCTTLLTSSIIPLYYVPMLPFIKVAFSVFSWLVAVFEAVMVLPIAAITLIESKSEGIFTNKTLLGTWANMLFRPILTVIGFIGAILVLNTFYIYFSYGFTQALSTSSIEGSSILAPYLHAVAVTVMYCTGIYTAVNTSFTLMEWLPAAAMKHLGAPGDHSISDGMKGGVSEVGKAAAVATTSGGLKTSTAASDARKDEVADGNTSVMNKKELDKHNKDEAMKQRADDYYKSQNEKNVGKDTGNTDGSGI